jgi:hypothetical protein
VLRTSRVSREPNVRRSTCLAWWREYPSRAEENPANRAERAGSSLGTIARYRWRRSGRRYDHQARVRPEAPGEGSHASDQRERHSLETRRSSSRKYVFPGRAAVRDTRSPGICGTRVRQAGASGRWGRSLLPRRRRVQPGRLAHPDRCGILTRPIPGRTPAAKLLSLGLVTGMRLPRLTLSRRDRLLTPCG